MTTHKISFETVVPLKSTFSMVLIYPAQAKVPKDGCGPGLGLLSISCDVVQDLIKVKFETSQTELPVGSKISFTLLNATNPLTGKPSDSFKLYIKDEGGFVMSEVSSP